MYHYNHVSKNNCAVNIPLVLDLESIVNVKLFSGWETPEKKREDNASPVAIGHFKDKVKELGDWDTERQSNIMERYLIHSSEIDQDKQLSSKADLKVSKKEKKRSRAKTKGGSSEKTVSPSHYTSHGDFSNEDCPSIEDVEDIKDDGKIPDGSKSFIYHLKSLILHYGTHESGHFVTIKLLNGCWYYISDRNVQKISRDSIGSYSSYVYMLFYETLE
jgi:hypothetical protein